MKKNSSKILIVDDAEPMRISHKLVLADQGYSVETADDGVEALRKVAAFGPALVLIDTMMSEMDGIECCRQIKSSESTRDIKVVMISQNGDYEMITQAFAAGCDDFVIKPVDRSELLLTVKDVLRFSVLKSADCCVELK